MAVVWRFVGGYGCSVWEVVRTCSSAAWDEPSVRGSFLTLFLGGILWVLFSAHKRWAPMLGLVGREAVEHQRVWNENNEHNNMTCREWHGISCQSIHTSGRGAYVGLFIVGVQQSYDNALKFPNHLPHQ
jgi:hypothetical protein